MSNICYDDEATDKVIRFWMCRMLSTNKGQMLMRDDAMSRAADVAAFLGLHNKEDDTLLTGTQAIAHIDRLLRELKSKGEEPQFPCFFTENLAALKKMLNLSDLEIRVVAFLALKRGITVFSEALDLFGMKSRQSILTMMANVFAVPPKSVFALLQPDSKLLTSGLLKWDCFRTSEPYLEITKDALADALLNPGFNLDKALRSVANSAPKANLSYIDYPHLQEHLTTLRSYLRTGLNARTSGINIFFHGPPGTGKSQLARILAKEMRASVYEVSCEDDDGDSHSGTSRMMSLRMAQSFLKDQRALLVFDEAEDVFAAASFFHRSIAEERKGWVNRMLENNPVPTIWISNNGSGMDAAFVRRFDFCIQIDTPPRGQRQKTLGRICESLPAAVIDHLAGFPELTPAVAARAFNVAQKAHGKSSPEAVQSATLRLIEQTLCTQGHKVNLSKGLQEGDSVLMFDPTLLQCDMDLKKVLANIPANSGCRICIYGPPGTGKTAFGHWLARQLEMPLQLQRASDILDPYVGGTEAKLARSFARAHSDNSLLMIDEVDSFLRNRNHAKRSWEVTAVNEFLTQMECFEGLFIASTNLMHDIDPAALRRFDLKVRLDYLPADKAQAFFLKHCQHLALPPPDQATLAQLQKLVNLTPGDFANVTRQHRFRCFDSSADYLAALLHECELKPTTGSRAVGF